MNKELNSVSRTEAIATFTIIILFIPFISISILKIDGGYIDHGKAFLAVAVFCLLIGIWSYFAYRKFIPFGIGTILYFAGMIIVSYQFGIESLSYTIFGIFYLGLATVNSFRIYHRKNTHSFWGIKPEKSSQKSKYNSYKVDVDTALFEETQKNLSELQAAKEKIKKHLD